MVSHDHDMVIPRARALVSTWRVGAGLDLEYQVQRREYCLIEVKSEEGIMGGN